MNEILQNNGLTSEQNQQLIKLLALLNSGQASIQRERRVTVGSGLSRYLEISNSTISKSTKKIVVAAYKHFSDYFGSNSYVDEIMNKEGILDFRNYLYSKKNIKSNTYWKHLRSVFNTLSEINYFDHNYFNDVRPPKFQDPEILSISRQELNLICENSNSQFADIFLFTWLNGLRLAEVINLSYEQINFTKKIMTIGSQHFVTKGKRIRGIPIGEESFKLLIKHRPKIFNKNKINYVFRKKSGHKFSADYVSKQFKMTIKISGLDGRLKFHNLRSSFATNLSEKGVSVPTIQRLLGHTDISVTMRYVAVDLNSLRAAVSTLDRFNLVGG